VILLATVEKLRMGERRRERQRGNENQVSHETPGAKASVATGSERYGASSAYISSLAAFDRSGPALPE